MFWCNAGESHPSVVRQLEGNQRALKRDGRRSEGTHTVHYFWDLGPQPSRQTDSLPIAPNQPVKIPVVSCCSQAKTLGRIRPLFSNKCNPKKVSIMACKQTLRKNIAPLKGRRYVYTIPNMHETGILT